MKRITIALALLLFASGLARAQAGYLDKTFGSNGEVIVHPTEPGVNTYDVKVLSDGKIIHCGWMTGGTAGSMIYVMMHHADGTIDSGFGDSGLATYKIPDNFFGGRLLVYPDERILVFGSLWPKSSQHGKPTIVRFLPNGSVDSSFGSGGEYDGSGFTRGSSFMRLKLMTDGSIVALGSRSSSDTSTRLDPMITRITAEGKNDSSFGNSGILVIPLEQYTTFISDAHFYQTDQCIFSYTSGVSGKSNLHMLRTDMSGSKDSSFGSNGTVTMQLSDVRTYVSYFTENSGNDLLCLVQRDVSIAPKSSLMRFAGDGKIDETFGNWGVAESIDSLDNKYFSHSILDSSNNIIVVGEKTDGFFSLGSLIARYGRDGVVDSSFGVGGVGYGIPEGISLTSAAVQSDGKYVVVGLHIGNAAQNYIVLYRFNNMGSTGVGRNSVLSSPISLHPTPSIDNCTVTYTLPTSGECTMTLRDESGREVRTFATNEYRTAGEHKEELDLRGLAVGVYFLQVESNGTIQTAKLIKQ